MGPDVDNRLTASSMYAHGWSTPEYDRMFEQKHRLQAWLNILVALAQAQAELGIIPDAAFEGIASKARVELLDEDFISSETRRTSHSTLGLIRGLQQILDSSSTEYVYFGTTVQDLTDTWFGMVMRDSSDLIRADLVNLRDSCVELAKKHRDTTIAGRTHGQLGTPVTFGFKVSTWADEMNRHIERIDGARARWSVGQLAGSTGGLAFFPDQGLHLRSRFCELLGLGDPGMSWTATRDRIAEFGTTMATVASSLARVGNEIYELARPEIGELSESRDVHAVGSITMPHKQNPELSEHLDTLSRIARAAAGVLVEGVVSSHERDGRSWKAEWAMLPEVAMCTGKAASVAADLVAGLRVHPEKMLRNLESAGPGNTESVLHALSSRIGKHQAQELMQVALSERDGTEDFQSIAALIAAAAHVSPEIVLEWMSVGPTTGPLIDHCLSLIEMGDGESD